MFLGISHNTSLLDSPKLFMTNLPSIALEKEGEEKREEGDREGKGVGERGGCGGGREREEDEGGGGG